MQHHSTPEICSITHYIFHHYPTIIPPLSHVYIYIYLYKYTHCTYLSLTYQMIKYFNHALPFFSWGVSFMTAVTAGIGWPAERELSWQCARVWVCFYCVLNRWKGTYRIPRYTKVFPQQFRVFDFMFLFFFLKSNQ